MQSHYQNVVSSCYQILRIAQDDTMIGKFRFDTIPFSIFLLIQSLPNP